MDVIVDELIIEKDRPEHIAKHKVTVEQVLEIVSGDYIFIESKLVKKVKKGSIKPIPPFKTLEEEANFWDTHSIVDQIDEGTLVGFHHANKTHTITIRFDPNYLQKLREKAFELGIGPTTLARMWLMEKLQASRT